MPSRSVRFMYSSLVELHLCISCYNHAIVHSRDHTHTLQVAGRRFADGPVGLRARGRADRLDSSHLVVLRWIGFRVLRHAGCQEPGFTKYSSHPNTDRSSGVATHDFAGFWSYTDPSADLYTYTYAYRRTDRRYNPHPALDPFTYEHTVTFQHANSRTQHLARA